MIKIENLQKGHIIKDFSLNIDENKKVALIGNNGSGKSTLLYLLSGTLLADSGLITYNKNKFKFPIKNHGYYKFIKYLRRNILYIENSDTLYENFTIRQNFKHFISLGEYDKKQFKNLYEIFEVNEPMNKLISQISKGTKQKLIIILALLSKKNIILLDEPTDGLDPDKKELFFGKIVELNKTIIISTHDVQYINCFNQVYTFNKTTEM